MLWTTCGLPSQAREQSLFLYSQVTRLLSRMHTVLPQGGSVLWFEDCQSDRYRTIMYTIGQAAKATGKSKSTISAYIKKGKIPANKNEDSSYTIDPTDLH